MLLDGGEKSKWTIKLLYNVRIAGLHLPKMLSDGRMAVLIKLHLDGLPGA